MYPITRKTAEPADGTPLVPPAAAAAEVFAAEDFNARRFLDDAFKSKGSKRGFKNAKEWIEHLILAEDLIEKDPAATLKFLARVYGLDFGGGGDCGALLQLCTAIASQVEAMLGEVSLLRQKFEAKTKSETELLAKAEEAKAAKEAAFSVFGRRGNADTAGLTTREMLERQFAALND